MFDHAACDKYHFTLPQAELSTFEAFIVDKQVWRAVLLAAPTCLMWQWAAVKSGNAARTMTNAQARSRRIMNE